jgi:hypothetical protein
MMGAGGSNGKGFTTKGHGAKWKSEFEFSLGCFGGGG